MITNLGNSEHYKWGTNCDGWHLLKSESLSVIYERMPPGTQEARHFHNKAEQFFFVLSGEAVMELEGKEFVMGAKACMCRRASRTRCSIAAKRRSSFLSSRSRLLMGTE